MVLYLFEVVFDLWKPYGPKLKFDACMHVMADAWMHNFITIMLDYHVSMFMFMLMFMSYWIFMIKHGFVGPMIMVREHDMMAWWWDNDHENESMNCNMVLRWWHCMMICKGNKLDFLLTLLKIKLCMVYDLNENWFMVWCKNKLNLIMMFVNEWDSNINANVNWFKIW